MGAKPKILLHKGISQENLAACSGLEGITRKGKLTGYTWHDLSSHDVLLCYLEAGWRRRIHSKQTQGDSHRQYNGDCLKTHCMLHWATKSAASLWLFTRHEMIA